jgi:hypothetical protein
MSWRGKVKCERKKKEKVNAGTKQKQVFGESE